MRDYNNIVVDVNNSNYKTYKYSNLNFKKLNKKQLYNYLIKLIGHINNYVFNILKGKIKQYKHIEKGYINLRFYTLKRFDYTELYAIKKYNRSQLLEGITACLFKFNQFIKYVLIENSWS